MLKFASTLEALHLTIQKCWRQAIVPTLWKEEASIFIPKADNQTTMLPRHVDPLASSIVGKSYERIVTRRLYSFLLSNFLFDPNLYAYQNNKSIIQAILFYSLNVLRSFNGRQCIVSAFIDPEGAFDIDNMWRKGLL
jgi:hypothetical protein